MPITLAPITRRRFLAGSASAAAMLLAGNACARPVPVDPNRLALLSDTHIAADPMAGERGVVMYENFKHVRRELLALNPAPAAVLINGDCAYHSGQMGDYRTLLELVRPLREHGLPLHLAMGNHDLRENLWKTLPHSYEHVQGMPDRQIVVLRHPRVNIFMLDSLQRTNLTPGLLGEKQLDWLSAALERHADRPAVVMVHHNPDDHPQTTGLLDTEALLRVLLPRRQVKALLYGHTHEWQYSKREDLHFVNLPAVAYVFQPGQPSGWVDARLGRGGMSLELRCIDVSHPRHGQKLELTWRA